MKTLAPFLLRRLLLSLITIFVIATATFILMKAVPGDPFQDDKGIPEECIQNLRRFYGLDDPLHVQYLRYLQSIFTLQFGPSLKYPSQTVNGIIAQGFPVSALLGIEALLIALPCGAILAFIAAMRHRHLQDKLTTVIAVLGISIPSFVLASSLQFFFAIYFPIFPIARFHSFMHTILPAIALAIGPCCMISRLLRASILEVLNQEYIHTAHAKGLGLRQIFTFHVLKNASLPILSYLGPVITNILVGSFIVERIFAVPGLGQWFVTGVMNRDYPVIGGLTLFYSIILLGVHTVIDLINSLLDPRVTLYAK
ncbi:MAG: peptide transporter permease [Chlamydiia bacterium]|nr:peptide transporter permease [Chlamydiia bacterium]